MDIQEIKRLARAGYYLVPVAAPACLLKAWYSGADNWSLQWVLQPLAALTGMITGLDFEVDGFGNWINHVNHIAIVKSCAGVNFMVLSLLIYQYRGMKFLQRHTGVITRVFQYLFVGVSCLFAAWYTALFVNTLRIGLAIYLYLENFTLPGLGSREIHLAAGVLLYFPALWLQCLVCCGTGITHTGKVALGCYLGMVVLVPVLSGNFLEQPRGFLWHVLVTVLTLLMVFAAGYTIRFLIRGIKPGQPDGGLSG